VGGGFQTVNCELKYVIHSLGDQFRLQVNTLTFSNRSLDGETIWG
jgi:hypothetical protein